MSSIEQVQAVNNIAPWDERIPVAISCEAEPWLVDEYDININFFRRVLLRAKEESPETI